MTVGTITTQVVSTVTLGSSDYASLLTITNTGNVSPTASSAAGVFSSASTSGTLVVAGIVGGNSGNDGTAGSSAGGSGTAGLPAASPSISRVAEQRQMRAR